MPGTKINNLTTSAAVEQALKEFDTIGREAFLKKHKFGPSTTYFIERGERKYDSKAIAAVAYGYQHKSDGPLKYNELHGGKQVVSALTRLGFNVIRQGQELQIGTFYTRKQLKESFEIEDATINNGVFVPADSKTIWLFITKEKASDRTQYEDDLIGDQLHWDGQMKGRTDQAIIDHQKNGYQLLVFYRESKSAHPGSAFVYQGKFNYGSHQGSSPTHFVLQRSSGAPNLNQDPFIFDPSSIEDGRKKILAEIKRRQGQPAFRQALLKAYERKCAITGCDIEQLLEAAHIHPYRGSETNHIQNGLLLRADIHTLFDLGYLTVLENGRLSASKELYGTDYAKLDGEKLRLPISKHDRPSKLCLKWHRESNN